jgi:ABC-type sulfate transport system substrate-binding protein
VAGQDQPDKDQQDNKTGSSVKKFLHDVFVFDRGARLFHSTMPG